MKPFADLDVQGANIAVCTPDMAGRLIGKIRSASEWPEIMAAGIAVPNFHLVTNLENRPQAGFATAGEATGFANSRILPDPEAAFLSPSLPGAPHVLADALEADGSRTAEAPREILRRQIARLDALGVTATVASELEFYAFSQSFAETREGGYGTLKPFYHRHGDNDVLVTSLFLPFIDEVGAALAASGIVVDQVQTEGGVGQVEINVRPDGALASADNHVVFKHIVKAVAHRTGHAVTFLAKPFQGDAGSGGHIHMSIRDAGGSNLIGDADGKLTEFGRHFIAGLAAFTPELVLLHAPYLNSYRRLVPGSYTPLQANWGYDNRAAMVRLLATSSGTRFELRLPGADVNPYLAYAGLIAAGLAGVEAGTRLIDAKSGDGHSDGVAVPGDLSEAIAAFSQSELARTAFTSGVQEHILVHARNELNASRRVVSPWEIERGFENA